MIPFLLSTLVGQTKIVLKCFTETLDAQCCSSCGKMNSNALCVCCRTARAGVGVSPGIVTETVKTD